MKGDTVRESWEGFNPVLVRAAIAETFAADGQPVTYIENFLTDSTGLSKADIEAVVAGVQSIRSGQ